MPTYEYRCRSCSNIQEEVHSIKIDPEIKCEKCSDSTERLISNNFAGVIFKGGTETMAWKEKRIRHKKNKDLELRQINRWGTGPKLQPNVAGHEVESWSDASKLAKESGMRADTYQPLIEKNKYISKESGVDDRKWKKAKEEKNK